MIKESVCLCVPAYSHACLPACYLQDLCFCRNLRQGLACGHYITKLVEQGTIWRTQFLIVETILIT